ncbi:hypothetical protein V2G26_008015 [Clonostachys chloroleuca]
MPSATNRRVGVIGAGVSGVVTAAHLLSEGLDVTVFERAPVAGGVWVWESRVPHEPTYPSAKPSVAESTFFKAATNGEKKAWLSEPTPAYDSLKNNVPTELLETTLNPLKPGTESFVLHNVLKDYIQDTAEKTGVTKNTQFNTRVEHVSKTGDQWKLVSSTWDEAKGEAVSKEWSFDSVIVASGHYHAPRVPNIRGLSEWKSKFPSRIQHSKSYRNANGYENQNVLVIGGSASSLDAVKEIVPVAKKVWQSTRGGAFDLPVAVLPDEVERIGEVVEFHPPGQDSAEGSIGNATLADGTVIKDIDRIIVATGYQFSLPFLLEYHRDDVKASDADDKVLVTDGTQLHNLHHDIFYIPDPTLIFIGVPFYTATFSFFEFQAIAAAAFLSGKAKLPSVEAQRAEYSERVKAKGFGKKFHARLGEDLEYAAGLMKWVNEGRDPADRKPDGYSEKWIADRERLRHNPDPKNSLFEKTKI